MAKPTETTVRIGQDRLDLVPALADCDYWLEPTEYNVIVAPAEAPKTVGKAGLIIAPDDTRENADLAIQIGRLVAASPVAFNYERWPKGTNPPQVGQVVWYARYAGTQYEGPDGRTYRMIKDKDIGAVVPPLKNRTNKTAAPYNADTEDAMKDKAA